MRPAQPGRFENKHTGEVVTVLRMEEKVTGYPVMVYQRDGSEVEERWTLRGEGDIPAWTDIWRAVWMEHDDDAPQLPESIADDGSIAVEGEKAVPRLPETGGDSPWVTADELCLPEGRENAQEAG